MIHLIALIKINDDKYAYHYPSNDKDEIKMKQNELINNSDSNELLSYSLHILKTNSKKFSSVQEKDPYFQYVITLDTIDDFLSFIDSRKNFQSVDIASYLLRKYEFGSFALQKVLYYIYAGFLEKFDKKLFNAHFLAFDKGPVDMEIYKQNKYYKDKLMSNLSFDKKIATSSERDNILSFINKIAYTYGNYYEKIWNKYDSNNSKLNLTHRKDTPWFVSKNKSGKNGAISDNDIKQLHHNEKLNNC